MFDVKIIWPPLIGCIFTPPDSNSRGGLFPSPAFSAQLFNLNCMLLRLACIQCLLFSNLSLCDPNPTLQISGYPARAGYQSLPDLGDDKACDPSPFL